MDDYGIKQTYTPYECPRANGLAERFIKPVKDEKTWHFVFETMGEAEKATRNFIQEYNHERLHSNLDYTPSAVFFRTVSKKGRLMGVEIEVVTVHPEIRRKRNVTSTALEDSSIDGRDFGVGFTGNSCRGGQR